MSKFVSPLRDGAKRGGPVVGAEDLSSPPTPLPALSEPISISIMLRVPPSHLDTEPKWLEAEATKQIKTAILTLGAKMEAPPREIERQVRMDGDGESWWIARGLPKKPQRNRSLVPPEVTMDNFIPLTLFTSPLFGPFPKTDGEKS
jgi:hypothetical protein